jgi:hypothetical protein
MILSPLSAGDRDPCSRTVTQPVAQALPVLYLSPSVSILGQNTGLNLSLFPCTSTKSVWEGRSSAGRRADDPEGHGGRIGYFTSAPGPRRFAFFLLFWLHGGSGRDERGGWMHARSGWGEGRRGSRRAGGAPEPPFRRATSSCLRLSNGRRLPLHRRTGCRRRWPYLWPGRLAERVHWKIPAAERHSSLNLAKAILCLQHVLELVFLMRFLQ